MIENSWGAGLAMPPNSADWHEPLTALAEFLRTPGLLIAPTSTILSHP